jgi:RNA polymerase sigma-70 factor (ECF subfamily)
VYQPQGSSTTARPQSRPLPQQLDALSREAALPLVSDPDDTDTTKVQHASLRPQLRVVASDGDKEEPEQVDSGKDRKSNPVRATAAMTDADFRTLYDTHFRLVWSSLSRLGVHEDDLKDLTQKVFLTAYLKLPEFEGRSLLSTWLWSITRRVALAHRRYGPARREVATDPSSFEGLPEESNNVASDRDAAQRAGAILGKLTESQRVVLLLFEVDQMNGREIATLLDIPLGTVRSRLRYARNRFRREAERLEAVRKTARQ